MQIGLQLPHIGAHASADYVRDFAQTAEAAGFDSLWVADHLAVPRTSVSLYTLGETPARPPDGSLAAILGANFEGTTTLTFVAGLTKRVRLGTSVAVLSLRNPLLNARMLATLDALSGGRLVYGAGPGWLREEAEALGMPWDHRGTRADEHIELMRTVWTAPGPYVAYHGRFYSFDEIEVHPRPAQSGGPPILIGGHSDAAIGRAGRLGDGWMPSRMTPERAAEGFDRVKAAATAAGRDPAALKLYASVDFSPAQDLRGAAVLNDAGAIRSSVASGRTPAVAFDEILEVVQSYRRAGAHHLKLSTRMATQRAELAWVEGVAEHVLPSVRAAD